MGSVVLENVSKRFGDVVAADDVSLTCEDGEFLVLLGASGSGKTTLLRLIAGLETATSGTIRIGARVVNDIAPKDRNVAMVFQNYALYPHMRVRANMSLALKQAGLRRDEIRRRVDEAAGMLGISGLMERLPRQLSGGQQQRVALGRAVVREPEVFLMDEPLSNLDARLRVETRGELVRLYRRLGATIVYVTHDQTEAMTMGTKIAVLHHGVLQQVGTPWEIFDRPVNQFVAGFMGETRMNFIHGELSGAQDAMTMRAGTVNLPVPQTFLRARNVDGRGVISLGVRPEHFELTEPGTGDLTGRVELYERLGSRALLTVLSGDLSLVVEAAAHRETPLGSTVGLAVNWRHAHVFDTDSGATLLPPMAPVG